MWLFVECVCVCVWPVCRERIGECMSERVGKADYDKLLNEQQVCCFV